MEYDATYRTQRTCGQACGIELRRRVGSWPTEQVWPTSKVYFPDCRICGGAFATRFKAQVLCGKADCRREARRRAGQLSYQRNKATYLKAAHVRRARLALVKWERVDPVTVYERDQWRCGICGESVRRTARRKHDPEMASLDHIIPIAHGGDHTYANVRCAHYRCNLSRGARLELARGNDDDHFFQNCHPTSPAPSFSFFAREAKPRKRS